MSTAASDERILKNPSRLIWACRRGMLELDLVLNDFLREEYPKLSIDNKLRFIRLLDCNDMDLFAWLIRQCDDVAEEHVTIVNMICKHARSRIPI